MQSKQTLRDAYLKQINKVVEYINNNLDNELTLSKLAEISCFSPFHFHRIMKAFLGESLGAYISRIRIETAAGLLRYTKLPIEEIAYSIGFEMPSSLSKAFKQHYGISASAYRNHKNSQTMKTPLIHEELSLKAPKMVALESKTVIYIQITGEYGNANYGDTWNRLWGFVKAHSLFTAGMESIGLSHDDPNITDSEKCRYDACLVIHKPVQPEGEVGVKELAGGKFAVFQYQGSYANLSIVYDTIFGKWLPESGFELRNAPCFEKYLNNPNRTEPAKLKTEIYLPVL